MKGTNRRFASTAPGQFRRMRDRLGLTIQDFECISRESAHRRGSQEYILRHRWVTQLETTKASLSIPKLHSLMTIYRCDLSAVLPDLDADLVGVEKSIAVHLQWTTLGAISAQTEDAVAVPRSHGPDDKPSGTMLDSELREEGSRISTTRLEATTSQNFLYGQIGLRDLTFYPVLRPGMWVRIDPQQNRIQSALCGSELERPIYLVELRDAYVCGWCEIEGSDLVVIPHPLSGEMAKRYEYPTSASMVGGLVGFAEPPAQAHFNQRGDATA